MRQLDLKSTQFPAIVNAVRTSCCVVVLALCVAGCQKATETPSKADAPVRALHRGLGAEPETLNPLLAVDNAALAVVGDLYEGLATEAPDGTIVPGAAREWQVSPDGLSWTFVLRPNLRWSNGDSLVAGHFAAGLRASLAPGAQAPNAGLLDNVRSVEVLAPDRLRIDLKRPVPYLPALLALPMASPTHPAAGNTRTPPSNGPFRLVRWQRGDRIEVERNPYYRSANSVHLDRVTYRLLADLGTEVNLYRTGELDLTSEVPNAQLPWLREHLPAELKIAPYLSTYAYAVNLRRLPDRGARTALAMAIDRERITALVTGAGEEPAYGWLPPGVPGYPRQNFSWRDWPAERRMAQARALWRETVARKAAPTALTLCTDASANHHRTAIALADQWREVLGTHVNIVELEWNVYLATRTAPGDCDLVRLGWSADFADAEAFAAIFESGHPQNSLGYRSASYDALLARSRATGDAVERARLLSEAERIVLEDVPVIPIFHRVAKRLVKPQVTGYAANPLGHLSSRDLSLDR
jgi:ABC-type oligopeptide transport system substrate-binding subunit